MKFTLLTRLKKALPQSQFASAVTTQCQLLSELARPLFAATNPKDAQIWAFLIRHLGHTARATVLKVWLKRLTTRTFGALSSIIVVTFLALSTRAAARFWRDNNALYINIGFLFGSAFVVCCIHYLQKPLAWNKHLSERTIVTLIVYLSFLAAVGPLCILGILKSYALLPAQLESIAQASLIIGATLLFLLAVLRLHTIALSTLSDQIDKYYLPSQLPWALTLALYEIATGDSYKYNRTLIHTPLDRFLNGAKEISARIPLPADVSQNDWLLQRDSIRRAIALTEKQLQEWLCPLFLEIPEIKEMPYSTHLEVNPITMDIYDQLNVVRRTLGALESDVNGTYRWGFNLHNERYEQTKKTFAQHIAAHSDAVDKLKHLLTSPPFTTNQRSFRPDQPDASAHIALHLENAAKIMALVPLILPKVNYRETRWTNQVYSERAQAIRNLKTWVLLPLDCSRHDLEEKVRQILLVISQGYWGALEQHELPTLPSLPIHTQALNFVRKIAVAFLPLGLFLIAEQVDSHMDAQIKASVLSLVLGWTGISLLSLLDSKYAEKLSSFKDVGDIFRSSQQKREPDGEQGTGQSLTK